MPQLDNSSPFALTGSGQTLVLTQPGGGVYPSQSPPAWVLLQNDSSLQVNWSTGADQGSIQAWAKDIIQLSGSGAGAGVQKVTCTTSGFGSGTLAVTWSNDGDPMPSGYPSTSGVSASAIAAQAAVLIGKVFSATTWAFTTPVCPPGAIGLMVAFTGIFATGITVTGSTSGFLYGPSFSLSADPVFLPYNSTADPQLNVAGTSSGLGGTLEIYALFAASGAIGYGASVGGANAPIPPWAMLIAGQYSGNLAPLQTDTNGRLVPLVPTVAVIFGATGTVLAAPPLGAYYLFDCTMYNGSGAPVACSLTANGGVIGALNTVAAVGGGYAIDRERFSGLRVTTAITVAYGTGSGDANSTLRYAPGP